MGFYQWLTSGWGDGWSDPVGNVKDGFEWLVGVNPGTSGDGSSGDGDAFPPIAATDGTASTASTPTWLYGVLIVAGLFLLVVLVREGERVI